MPHFPTAQKTSVAEDSANDKNGDESRDMRIRIKNRRMRYLELHPEYFKESSLELADPLLYDRLIRRFQSADEREKEGREKGYSGVLEANLVRSEAKLDALQHPDPNSPMAYARAPDGSITAVEQDVDERASTKENGWERWKDVMGQRFLRGGDADFDYSSVDDNDDYDDRAEEDQRKLEDYLNDEEEQYLGEGKPTAQTGVQDY